VKHCRGIAIGRETIAGLSNISARRREGIVDILAEEGIVINVFNAIMLYT